jgi:hypothetical protein
MRWVTLVSVVVLTIFAATSALPTDPLAQAEQAGQRSAKAADSKPADSKAANPKTEDGSQRSKGMPGLTPEREEAVLAFVRKHHPELADLLQSLRDGENKAYAQALRDLFRVTERLAQVHERDPMAYELELSAWKTKSRVQLLAARVKMSPSDNLRRQLKEALREEIGMRRAVLSHERERMSERLQRLETQIETIDLDREKMVERQFEFLTRPERKEGASESGPLPVEAGGGTPPDSAPRKSPPKT